MASLSKLSDGIALTHFIVAADVEHADAWVLVWHEVCRAERQAIAHSPNRSR